MNLDALPQVIQGGMGIGVSDWRLARAVSAAGQLGVVSGSGLDTLVARTLQDGDPDGTLRRALSRFPIPAMARQVIERYFVPGGKRPGARYRGRALHALPFSRDLDVLVVTATFAHVALALEGHANAVGINLLEKVQAFSLPILYGAMLAGVGFVLMGAGVPRSIPGALDRLARGETATLSVAVEDEAPGSGATSVFDPASFWGGAAPALARPAFLAIVSSASLAAMLLRKANGRVDGFVVEGPSAGGHNAPPRGGVPVERGSPPVYGDRDVADLAAMRALDRPFWVAGSYGSRDGLDRARRAGAAGIQVGTAFAYCEESGIDAALKRRVVEASRRGEAHVRTDAHASPTGFPFKVVSLGDTLSDPDVYASRERICDLGYLRTAYRRSDGRLGWRCPAEPVEDYVAKGGRAEDAAGRMCLCNGLFSTIGLAQATAEGGTEPPLLTSGADVAHVADFLPPGSATYRAADVLAALLG